MTQHHHPRPRGPHAPVPEKDFLDGHALLHGVTHEDPRRLRLMMLDMLDDAFPFNPSLAERILLRLGALGAIWQHPVMEAWKTAPAAGALGDTALRLAATHALTENGWFDPDSFFAEMLRRMADAGHA